MHIILKLFSRINHYQLLFFLGFSLLLLVYYISMPKTVALEDDGLFILSSFFNGVSHPPGYPLHSLIGHLATLFPTPNVAVKVHMVSAFFGALASMLAGVFVYTLYKNTLLSSFTIVVVGLGQGFWSQSIISEVYTLNAFLVILLMLLVLKFKLILTDEVIVSNKEFVINKYVFYIFLCVGLGLSNHWPLFILGGAGCAVIIPYVLPDKKYLTKICIATTGILFGSLPYAWMVYNSNNDPFISFVGPLTNFSEFYDVVSRKIYMDGIDSQENAGLFDKVSYMFFGLTKSLTEHFYFGAFFVIAGVIHFSKNKYSSLLLLSCFFITPVVLPVLLNYSFNDWYKVVYKPYLLVPLMLSGILLSVGGYQLTKNLKQASLILSVMMIFVIVSGIYLTSAKNYRADYDFSLDYAYTVLDALDKNSILIIGGDVEMSTLPFVRYILKHRADVDIIHQNSRLLNTRLFDTRYLTKKETQSKLLQYIKNSERPVYLTSFLPGVGLENHWLYYKVNKSYKNNKLALVDTSVHNEFLKRVLGDKKDLDDEWTNDFAEILKTRAIPILFRSIVKAENKEQMQIYIKKVQLLFYDITNFIHAGFYIRNFSLYKFFGGEMELNRIGDMLFSGEKDVIKRAHYLNFKAQNSLIYRDYDNALHFYHLSIQEWNNKKNIAVEQVNSLCKEKFSSQPISICNDI